MTNREIMELSYERQPVNFSDMDLSNAKLWKIKLNQAKLTNTNLSNTDLTFSTLTYLTAKGSNFSSSNLAYADLRGSNFTDANFTNANLRHSDLRFSGFAEADLTGAHLNYAIGNASTIISMQCGEFHVVYTFDMMFIDCQSHSIKNWFDFTDDEITTMHKRALPWWKVWKPILTQILQNSPAKSTAVPI